MNISSLNYHTLLNHMIEQCIEHARNNPFEKHYFISDNPSIIEQCFFKYTHTLVNIEVLSFYDYLKEMIIEYHYNNHSIVSSTELTYRLRKILLEKDFTCFNASNPYPLIDKFIPIMKTYELYELDYHIHHNKLNDLLLMYKSLKEELSEFKHLCIESLFDNCPFNHTKSTLYIDGSSLYTKKHLSILDKLKEHHDVYMFYTYKRNDTRLFNLPYQSLCTTTQELPNDNILLDQLFLQKITKKDNSQNYYYYESSTLHNEVKEAIYHIYSKITDENLRYEDFAIIYPNNEYIHIIQNVLDSLNIPHHLKQETSCIYDKDYKDIINDSLCDKHSFHDIADYFLSKDLQASYKDYFLCLKEFNGDIEFEEFILFFKQTYNKNKVIRNNNQDYIQVCHIKEAVFNQPKHVYYLGLNETVFPKRIKDTSLLLDEDLELLKGLRPFNTTEQLGLHYNDIIKALSFPHLSVTFSYSKSKLSNEILLESSLFKQLNHILTLNKKEKNKFLAIDDFYLQGGTYKEKDILNHNIESYINSKNNVDILDTALIKDIYSSHLSVSQIETYNKCPFMYFIKYGLNIKPSYSTELQSNEIGTLVHHVLELCIDSDLDTDNVIEEFIDHDEIMSKKILESPINRYFIDCLKNDIKITLHVLKKQSESSLFNIIEKERPISDKLNGLLFKGFVDRVDEFEDYISIIDYKSSSKDIDLNLAMQGFNIQMLVYLKMVTDKLGKLPGAVLYFNTKKRVLSADTRLYEPINEEEFYKQYRLNGYISDNDSHDVIKAIDPHMDKKSNIVNVTYVKSKDAYKGNILSIKSMNLLFDYISKHIEELYNQMISGHIEISPKGSDQSNIHTVVNPCTYCDYKCVCSFDHFYNEYKNVETLDVEKLLGGEDDGV